MGSLLGASRRRATPLTTPTSTLMYLALPGITELWPILVLVLIFFGARKLPGLARAMGSSVTQFKKGLKDEEKPEEIDSGDEPAADVSEESTSDEGTA